MTSFPVFFDTNVLYGSYLNDVLLHMAERGLFRPLWSQGVLEELESNLLEIARSDRQREALIRRVAKMQSAFPDAIVEGYEELVDTMTCDEKDRHVLAAAVRGGAALIVTFNPRDFPESASGPYGIEVVHPDQFLMDQVDLHPGRTKEIVLHLLGQYGNPGLAIEDYCEVLERSGVPDSARSLPSLLAYAA